MIVQAHRGLSAEHPENTLAAFRAAVDAGFDAIELDVRATHDGVVVVIHDAGVDRTTDGNGRVADFDWKELQHYQTAAGPIPTLEEVLDACKDFKGLWNVEVKANAATAGALQAIRTHGLIERSQISSMDPAALQLAHELEPNITRGFIILGPPDEEDYHIAKETQCTWLNLDHDFIPEELPPFKVAAWTVNDAERAAELDALGIHSVITDTAQFLSPVTNPAW